LPTGDPTIHVLIGERQALNDNEPTFSRKIHKDIHTLPPLGAENRESSSNWKKFPFLLHHLQAVRKRRENCLPKMSILIPHGVELEEK